MKSKCWFCLCVLLLMACSSTAPSETVQTAAYEGVIFDQDKAEAQNALLGFSTDYEAYRTLMAADIEELEAHLQPYLQTAAPDIAAKLNEYKRQYIGFWRQGKLYALVNAFCDDLGQDWRNQVVLVSDGGDCFFNVEYDMTEASFSNLYINGES